MKYMTAFLLGLGFCALASAKPLVSKAGEDYKGGVVTSWTHSGNTVSLNVAADADLPAVKAAIEQALPKATVTQTDHGISVSGLPLDKLLPILADVDVDIDADPLAELGLGDNVLAMQGPEGGGSIRATNPNGAPVDLEPVPFQDHNKRERIDAQVIAVKNHAFPHATIKFRIRRSAKAGPLKGELKYGKVLEADILYAGTSSGVDFASPITQRNLLAFYADNGDKLTVHLVRGKNDKFKIDWVKRK